MPAGLDERHDKVGSYIAEAAFPTAGLAVIQGTAQGEVDLSGADPNTIIGVIAYPVLINEVVAIVEDGHVKVVAGAAVSIGDPLAIDAAAKFITAPTGDYIHGYALQAASGADVEFIAALKPSGRAVAP
jgi:hypothetical protein